eukprot:CAMPEP_0117680862 /NCGR_PEP_ID=MMETSP0804-20121206/18611_1 /TAXON_ID=1074897 /ORGANISM="Tetraselmis astigmatica, Strain CCMP880" /LENGTH=99 /DNA_ID=CAMNT_0005490453 /DNA_START=620 /DNA_END=920 /DNA_ORIENTATION=-
MGDESCHHAGHRDDGRYEAREAPTLPMIWYRVKQIDDRIKVSIGCRKEADERGDDHQHGEKANAEKGSFKMFHFERRNTIEPPGSPASANVFNVGCKIW